MLGKLFNFPNTSSVIAIMVKTLLWKYIGYIFTFEVSESVFAIVTMIPCVCFCVCWHFVMFSGPQSLFFRVFSESVFDHDVYEGRRKGGLK